MIKAIIFDWGGVLIDNPAPVLIAYCSSYFNIPERELARVFHVYANSFQKGNIPENTLWEKVCSEFSIAKPEMSSLWANAFKKVYSGKKEVFSLASHLRKNGYKIGLLSNTETSAMEFFYEKKYDMFDALVFSCKEGITKPERRIYEIALEKLDVKA
ncbi:MAG: HAD-IA family hydrolase, partial [Candidatus Auribacterota bacterium]|nr:HAD-IA family hydrolase [Candidatus Auribacterota bacterium]